VTREICGGFLIRAVEVPGMVSGAPGCHNVERELFATAPPGTAPLHREGPGRVERAGRGGLAKDDRERLFDE
jgi:hypothetical protein